MIREVDLVSYLPPFLAKYKQTRAALEAENPEFSIAWNAADRVLRNEFIATADEYGISRYERILKIYPSKEDTIESRRARVQARWTSSLPYTERMFLEKLVSICGENDFTFTKKYEQYKMEIEVSLELFGQVEELENIIGEMIPCNMVAVIMNRIQCEARGIAGAGGGMCFARIFHITNDWKEEKEIEGDATIFGGVVVTEILGIN